PKLKPKRSKKQDKPVCPIPPPDLPPKFRQLIVEEMGGKGVVLVIQKTIFYSDINLTANHFSIPFSQVKTHDFLNEAEAKELTGKNPMQEWLLDPSMKGTSITFNKWVMGSSSLYVLTNTWNPVVKNNQLKKGDMVQLWSFQVNSLLCFALVKL
ncbi:hypothetical protein Goklo_026937, partial [Gossypium klotzschianum]|nr:hypothetical protein [Gossypium klotzschianum]